MGLISAYTSNTPRDIGCMTYVQYQRILKKVQTRVNFETKLFCLQLGGEISKDDFPWEVEKTEQKDRVYMSSLQGLLEMAGG